MHQSKSHARKMFVVCKTISPWQKRKNQRSMPSMMKFIWGQIIEINRMLAELLIFAEQLAHDQQS